MKILVADVGGNNVKLLATGRHKIVKVPSGPDLIPQRLVAGIHEATANWTYDAITIGLPAPVINGRLIREPVNLGGGWLGFDLAANFAKPVKLINDAAMQALGSYEGGRMLFLGLGTGLGSAMVLDGVVVPLELAHLPYRKGWTYEDCLGRRGLERLGQRKWERALADVVECFKAALVVEEVVIGGGNCKLLNEIPPGVRLGSNRHAFLGGFRLWSSKAA